MKKSLIITISGILAALLFSFIGANDLPIPVTEKQLQGIFEKIGDTYFDTVDESATEVNSHSLKIDDIPWATGEFENPEQNLIHHFKKHGKEVQVDSPQEYYDMANAIIDDEISIRIEDVYYENSLDYFQPETQFLVGLNPSGSINTFHKVTSQKKLEGLYEYINTR